MCASCGAAIPSGGSFCSRCGTKVGESPRDDLEVTNALTLIVKAIIGIAGALLLSYGGWILAVSVYAFLPEQSRAFAQSLGGVVGGILLIFFAFRFIDRFTKRKQKAMTVR